MVSFVQIVLSLVVIYISSHIYRFAQNIVNARKSGLPFVVFPGDQNSIPWMVLALPARPYFRRFLPKYIDDRINLATFGWEFRMKLRPWEELFGRPVKNFLFVGSGRLEFNTMDPDVVNEILRRPRDFEQLELISIIMSKFGHNVLTTNGDQWARQRKVIASVINERISKSVFDESVRQTHGMLSESALNVGDEASFVDTNRMFDLIKKLVINVLNGATMGQNVSWTDDSNEKPNPGYELTYIQAVKAIIWNVTGPILLPRWLLANWPSFIPGQKNMRRLALAIKEFPGLIRDLLDVERAEMQVHGGGSKNNIMSQLLLASDQTSKGSAQGLTDDEIAGNLFVFTTAGFDTTAGALAYTLVLLARYPEWQDWLLEEVDHILPGDSFEKLDYTTLFPKATRIMAFMFETLRLYTPLVHIARSPSTSQTLNTSDGPIWIPAGTTCYLNAVGVHLNPKVWRGINGDAQPNLKLESKMKDTQEDEHIFRPTRWINPPGSSHPLFQPPKGAFLPWSYGPRTCPGQKMAQVEFTAILLTLLHKHRIEATPLGIENLDDLNRRLDETLSDSISIVTLQMKDVFEVPVDSTDGGLKLRLSKRSALKVES